MTASALAAAALALAPQLVDPPGSGGARPGASVDLLEEVGIDQRLGGKLPLDAPVRTPDGETVPLGSVVGERPFVLALVYYECPMLCSLSLDGLVDCLRALPFDAGDQFDVVTLSIDPEETPALASEKRASLVSAYGRPDTAAGWHVLTAGADTIRRVTEAVGFRYAYDPATDEYAHAAGIQVVTPDGRLSRYFYGVELSARDVRLGLVEAADGEIGSLADEVLLWCYAYDPATGRYGFFIFGSIRLLGIATVAAIATFVVRSIRRERRARRSTETFHEA